MTTRETSRRAILAGAAAVPVLALPAAAVCLVDADAELIVLGRLLEPIIAEWQEITIRDDAEREVLERFVFEQTGVWHEDAAADDDAYFEARGRACKEYERGRPSRADDEFDEYKSICDRADPIVDEIMSLPAHTMAGLGVKARALAYYYQERWTSPGEKELEFVSLVDDILRLAGVPNPIPSVALSA